MKKLLTIVLLLIITTAQAKICAVIVGVERYDNPANNLRASVDDALNMYRYLSADKKNKVVLLTNEDATKKNILYAMEKVYALAKKEDMIIFYFSGHGSKGMFCPHDVNNGFNGLWHTEVRNKFKKSVATNKLCIADACFSGSIVGGSNQSSGNYTTSTVNTGENVVIFMSSRDDEYSREDARLNAGLFTYYLVKGMGGLADQNKDRKITLYELYLYVRKNVRRESGKVQTPIMYGHFNRNAVISNY